MGKEYQLPKHVQKALELVSAAATAKSGSGEVQEVLRQSDDGLVVRYGESGAGSSAATRTEESLGANKVIIHKNTGLASGMYAAASRFNEVEVIKNGKRVGILRISVDDTSSPTNPIYLFFDGDSQIGVGYGQSMDYAIASSLGAKIPHPSDQVQQQVIEWIKGKLE
jgi:hypothetical protein